MNCRSNCFNETYNIFSDLLPILLKVKRISSPRTHQMIELRIHIYIILTCFLLNAVERHLDQRTKRITIVALKRKTIEDKVFISSAIMRIVAFFKRISALLTKIGEKKTWYGLLGIHTHERTSCTIELAPWIFTRVLLFDK